MSRTLLAVTTLVSAVIISIGSATGAVLPRIIDGEPAPIDLYPAYVGLSLHPSSGISHLCGGTLIADRWVLTAAHCFRRVPDIGTLRANIGMTRFRPTITARDQVMVKRVILHPGYDPDQFDTRFWYDAALVELERPAQSTDLMPLAASSEGLLPGAELWVAGFGVIAGQAPDVLMHTDSHVLADPFCAEVPPGYPTTTYNPAIHLCAQRAVTGGDSGGPILRMIPADHGQSAWEQVGIVANTVYPPAEMHTRVPAIKSWIDAHLAGTP